MTRRNCKTSSTRGWRSVGGHETEDNGRHSAERQTDLPELAVPGWARMLTGGVDVQETCLYWTIRAWGDHITSQNIAHGQAMSFADIERVMNLAYEREDGQKLVVCLCLIDSGYDSDGTYDFCANNFRLGLASQRLEQSHDVAFQDVKNQ